MKKTQSTTKIILSVSIFIVIILVITGISGCTTGQTQTTISTSVVSSTAETTLLEIPETEPVEEEKISSNFELLYVPKISPVVTEGTIQTDIPWFATIKAGMEKCAADYGFKVTIIGPPRFDAAMQTQIVLDNIGKNYDAVIACPIEEEIMDSAFERANKAGVLTFSNEGYNLKNISFDIEAMSNQDFGQKIMQSAINYSGSQGKYLISVGFLTSYAQNQWADAEIKFQKDNAASMVNVMGTASGSDRFEDNEDVKIAQDKLTEFFNNNADLKLVTGNSTSTSVAAGEVIAKKRLKGKVVNVGVGIPMIIEDHIINETMQEAFFWDPYLLGYSMGYIAFQTWLENTMEQGSFVASPDQQKIAGYESLELEKNSKGGSIIYGNATVSVNKDNLKDWNDKFSEYGWIK